MHNIEKSLFRSIAGFALEKKYLFLVVQLERQSSAPVPLIQPVFSCCSVRVLHPRAGVRFAGVSQESEDDLRYFMEIYQRPLQSVAFIVDEEGTFTDRYQGAHGLNTIPHCYIVRIAGSDSSSVVGVVEWHGHPTRLETALSYLLEGEDEGEDEKEEVR